MWLLLSAFVLFKPFPALELLLLLPPAPSTFVPGRCILVPLKPAPSVLLPWVIYAGLTVPQPQVQVSLAASEHPIPAALPSAPHSALGCLGWALGLAGWTAASSYRASRTVTREHVAVTLRLRDVEPLFSESQLVRDRAGQTKTKSGVSCFVPGAGMDSVRLLGQLDPGGVPPPMSPSLAFLAAPPDPGSGGGRGGQLLHHRPHAHRRPLRGRPAESHA